MENEEQTIEETQIEETSVEENNDSENVEDNTPTIEDYRSLEEKNKQLYERAKKAEEAARIAKTEKSSHLQTPGLSREEAILIAKGVDEKVLNEAALIAKAKGINIIEAVKDPLIVAFQEKLEKEERKAKAQLGASGSGGETTNNQPLYRPDMTAEERREADRKHREEWEKANR